MKAGVRATAVRFNEEYFASNFAASWDLLSPATQHVISQTIWIRVHDGCPSASTGKSRVIKSMTVFGDAAILTEALTGAVATTEDVFNYAHGRWSYAPEDLGIYLRGSVPADIAAVKAAGLCGSWKGF